MYYRQTTQLALRVIDPHAAGMDVVSRSHYDAIGCDEDVTNLAYMLKTLENLLSGTQWRTPLGQLH
jgi:hypothetical protein